jgi:hypothetical protein
LAQRLAILQERRDIEVGVVGQQITRKFAVDGIAD